MSLTQNFRNTLKLHPGDVANRIEWALREARIDPVPLLHMNADALVIEYNDRTTGAKMFERICGVTKKSS